MTPIFAVRASIDVAASNLIEGHVFDANDLERRLVVHLEVDGVDLGLVRADQFRAGLRDAGHGDGCYGFSLAIDPRKRSGRRVSLKLANSPAVLAESELTDRPAAIAGPIGSVAWRGGLRLFGVIRLFRYEDRPKGLSVFDGHREVKAEIRFEPPATAEDGSVAAGFAISLPFPLADGRFRMLRVIDHRGIELEGSPIAFAHHSQGVRGTLAVNPLGRVSEEIRQNTLDLLDALLPGSLPLEAYAAWSGATVLPPRAGGRKRGRIAAIVAGPPDSVTVSALRALFDVETEIASVSLSANLTLDAAAARAHLAAWQAAGIEYVVWLRAGARPRADLGRIIVMAADTQARRPMLITADHELSTARQSIPMFLPAFDLTRLLRQGHAEGLFATRADPSLVPNSERISFYDVLLATAQRAGEAESVHIPEVLAQVPALPRLAAQRALSRAVQQLLPAARIRPRVAALLPALSVGLKPARGEVDILIPTRDRIDLLEPCIESLFAQTKRRNWRVTVIDNGTRDAATLAYLDLIARRRRVRVLRDPSVFNYARLNNRAVAETMAPLICLLNNDIEITRPDWLDAMLAALQPGVGAVGARLVWPNGMLQHGGVVVGVGFAAAHAYDRSLANEPGYMDGLTVSREVTAVTAACLLMRTEDYRNVGGLDERAFPVAFNDVDLCLKLRAAGHKIIWCAEAELLHKESSSRGTDHEKPEKRARAMKELAELRAKWGTALLDDPYYNPNLSLDASPYSGLAYPPRDRRPRINSAPVVQSIWERGQVR
ncbi:MAG: glycosyltransferase [Bosea sp. (in: a-proteobacteria)]